MDIGMNILTGERITDVNHIRQSVSDILTTRIGTRIKRRTYGSLIPELIDQPNNDATRLRVMAATVMAIILWEPRIMVNKVSFEYGLDGHANIDMEATRIGGARNDSIFPISVRVN